MSCKQQPLLQRLAVEAPAALKSPAWTVHLAACPECRTERHGLERSLAVFRQFEAQRLPDGLTGPSWERVSRALARAQRRPFARLRVPLAAASVLVAVSTGVLLWPVAQEESQLPRPAKLVTLKPEQHLELRRVLNSSLEPPVAATAREGTHETVTAAPAAGADAPVLRVRGLEPAVVKPATLVARQEAPAPEPEPQEATPSIFGRTPTERTPVLLFRSLQQRRGRTSALQALPVFAPLQPDAGSLVRHALQSPRPIR
ncbi:MAG TPA: hypothetical protein VGC20_15640 [bacterium]